MYNVTSIPTIVANPTTWLIVAGIIVLILFLGIALKIIVGNKQ